MAHYSIGFATGMSDCRAPPDTRRAPREHSRTPHFRDTPTIHVTKGIVRRDWQINFFLTPQTEQGLKGVQ
jgi:hypothetical protein